MRYVDIILNLIQEQVKNMEFYSLVKLENFQTPQLYLELCTKISKTLKDENIEFVAKLSREKFLEWRDEDVYIPFINELSEKGYIEEVGSLTKWRNDNFLSTDEKKTFVMLMGTELVVDKGGLADFYTISPESVENEIGENYSCFFHDLESDSINNIYKNLFYYIEKDLFRLDQFAQNNYDLDTEIMIKSNILETLDEIWDFPNLYDIEPKLLSNLDKRIKIFEKAHKFNRRIGLDNLPTAKKIKSIEAKIDQYHEKNSLDLENEFSKLFPNYKDYDELKIDLIDYFSGISIDEKRKKLVRCDYTTLDKILGLKIGETTQTKNRDIKVYGNPINAIYVPLVKQIIDVKLNEDIDFDTSVLEVEEIKLANINNSEDMMKNGLVSKWNKLRRFIQGIDGLIEDAMRKALDVEYNFSVIATDIDDNKFAPLEKSNINDLVKSDILKSAALRDSVSKITYTIKTYENEQLLRSDRFVWYIFDTDSWVGSFDIIDESPALCDDKIDEISYYLPIGVSKGLEYAVDASNNDEFHEVFARAEINYLNSEVNGLSGDNLDTKAYVYGKDFINVLRSIEHKGFLGTIRSDVLQQYYKSYGAFIDVMLDAIKDTSQESKIYKFSKSMTIVSKEEDISKKGAQVTMIPAYHPVMLEKVVQRYLYLCLGLDELLELDFTEENITNSDIDKKYSMLDQLATITSATATTLNHMNNFEDQMKSYGYCTLYGKADQDSNDLNINASYTKEDDELESVSGKLIATPVSNYIRKTIRNYLSIYPYKQDGLKVMFFNPQNFSDIIAALKGIVDRIKKEKSMLRIELIIYTADYRCKVYNYVKSWIDNNISEDDSIDLTVRIKFVDYKLGNSRKTAEESIQNGDITFMFEIMEEVELKETPIDIEKSLDTMYPSTYLPIPKRIDNKRFLAISQLQFECEDQYTQLITRIKSPHIEKKSYQIQTESKLRDQFIEIIQVLHEKSNWVVVLDENVDPELIKFTGNEIIGYSTGEGYFGELNATISSSESILKDIRRYLLKRMKKEFSTWSNEEIKDAADKCIAYAYELDGAEVLKAINPKDEAIKDYLAFYLSTKIEQQSVDTNDYYYRKLLSLDLYDQLFDEDDLAGYLQRRPDFLLIEIPKKCNDLSDDSLLLINVRIIECKMGGNSYMTTAVDKAKEQVFAGYTTLKNIWENPQGIKRRYWHNQLYKILTLQNSIKLDAEELDRYAKKVMRIFNGDYNIEFDNCIYTYSLEQENNFFRDYVYQGIAIQQFNFGSITTKNSLLEQKNDIEYDFFNSKSNTKYTEPIYKSTDDSKDDYVEKVAEENTSFEYEKQVEDVEILSTDDDTETSIDITSDNPDIKENCNSPEVKPEKSYMRMIESADYRDIFNSYNISYSQEEENDLKHKLDRLDKELKERKTKVYIQDFVFGPDIIRVEMDLATGVNISQLRKYENDMKIWLKINEKPFIYIKDGRIVMDIIRSNRQTVGLKNMLDEIIARDLINDCKKKFYALLGADILGNPQLVDFSDSNTPHLLIAGQTGSGKSVLLNSMLLSVMMIYTPEEVEMILVDPKYIELSTFEDSPFTKSVITEAEDAVCELENLVDEMNSRYKTFLESKSKNISSYNRKTKSVKMKRILMVFDEYAALMEENKDLAKRLESAIKILSQKARAAGIHLIICTQSPRADIITTTIRNNLTARVGLRVADSVASGLVLDTSGAETLLGKGDMLLKTASSSEFLRAKSPFVTEEEIEIFIETCEETYNEQH